MQQVWKRVDLVQHIMSFLPGWVYRWEHTPSAFLRMRLVSKTCRDASVRVVKWWYDWLKNFGRKHGGKPYILKTVPLHIQVFRLGAQRATARYRAWYLRAIDQEVAMGKEHEIAQRQLHAATQGWEHQKQMYEALDKVYKARKRRRIDISALSKAVQ